MKILVTGGAGFIGSHLVDAYLQLGHQVAILDDFSTGKSENCNPQAIVFRGSIIDTHFLDRVFSEFQPELINHHAAQVSVAVSARNPELDADLNVVGTIKLIEAAKKVGTVRKIVFPSSGGTVYGDNPAMPWHEDTAAAPISPYGLSKHTAERYLMLLTRNTEITSTIFRYSNVFGPRQDPHGEAGVCSIFSLKMLHNEPVTIFGNGTPIRDYIFITDVVAANMKVIEGGDGEVFNVSSGQSIATMQVYETLKQAFQYSHEPILGPWRPGDMAKVSLSSEKLQSALGWKPEVIFTEGIEQLVSWYKKAAA